MSMGRKTSASKVSKVSNLDTSGVTWSGEALICNEQLKHYPAIRFRTSQTDIRIPAYSFVFIMIPDGDSVAYVQDLYENKHGEKRAIIRWFNSPKETALPESEKHAGEIFITATLQDLSVKCINGLAIVLTPNHFQIWRETIVGCTDSFFCHREYKNGRIIPFALNELPGYYEQQAISLLIENKLIPSEKGEGSGSCKPAVQVCEKTKRSTGKRLRIESSKEAVDPHIVVPEAVSHKLFKVNDNVEVLCEDSGKRRCWFKCKVLRSSPKHLKVLYYDVWDDVPEQLEGWVSGQKVADPDILGMRCPERLTVRPWSPHDDPSGYTLVVGASVDVWDDDRWWEGVIITVLPKEKFRVFFPGEREVRNIGKRHIRVSKDWIDGTWISINPKPEILPSITSILNSMNAEASPNIHARNLTSSSQELIFENRRSIKDNGGASGSGKAGEN